MARVYKFQSQDKSIDVDVLVDAIDDVRHFTITEFQDLQRAEVVLGFDLSRDRYYSELEFIEYATTKEYNLYRWDNQSYAGQLHEAVKIYYQELFRGLDTDIKDSEFDINNYGTGEDAADVKSFNQVLTLDGVGGYIDTGYRVEGGQPIDITLPMGSLTQMTQYPLYCGAFGANETARGFRLAFTSGGTVSIRVADGTTNTSYNFALSYLGNITNLLRVQWSGISGDEMTISINDDSDSKIINEQWVGDSIANLWVGRDVGGLYVASDIYKLKVTQSADVIEYNFKEGNGVKVYNRISDNYHGTIQGQQETVSWANKSENSINTLYKNGGELYVNDGDSNDKVRVEKALTGFLNLSISGYSKTEGHEPNVGVWDIGSKYKNQINSTTDNIFSMYPDLTPMLSSNEWDFDNIKEINLLNIPESDYIHSVEEGGTVIKEIKVKQE